MEHVSNEEKARELAFESPQCQMYIDNKCTQNFACDRFKVALEMAEWKDEQHAQEKQQWIDKAAEWVEKYLFEIGYPDDWLRDSSNIKNGKTRFIQVMKGE